jgi:hypothetical protein
MTSRASNVLACSWLAFPRNVAVIQPHEPQTLYAELAECHATGFARYVCPKESSGTRTSALLGCGKLCAFADELMQNHCWPTTAAVEFQPSYGTPRGGKPVKPRCNISPPESQVAVDAKYRDGRVRETLPASSGEFVYLPYGELQPARDLLNG